MKAPLEEFSTTAAPAPKRRRLRTGGAATTRLSESKLQQLKAPSRPSRTVFSYSGALMAKSAHIPLYWPCRVMSEAEFESALPNEQEREDFLNVYTKLKEREEWRWKVVPVVFLFPPPARGVKQHFDADYSLEPILESDIQALPRSSIEELREAFSTEDTVCSME